MSRLVRDSLKKAVKGTAFVFLSMVVSILIWFVDRIIIVRSTTIEEMGFYSMAVAVSGVIALIATMGLQEGATRYVSVFLGEGREEDARRVSRTALRLGLVFGLTASISMFFMSGPASSQMFYMPGLSGSLSAIALFPLAFVLMSVTVGVVRGYGDVRPRAYFINVGQPLVFLLMVLATLALDLPYIWIIRSYAAAAFVCAVGALVYGRVFWDIRLFSAAPGGFARKTLAFSIPLLAVAVIGIIFSWTDTLMIGRYMNAEDVAIYNVGSSMARLLGFVVNSLSFVFLPIAGDLFSRDRMPELKRIFQVLTKWVFAATFPMFFVLFFFPEMCITFLFEQRYEAASAPLSVLCLGHLVYVFVGVSGAVLMAMGMTREMMKISLCVMVVNILLNYFFLKVMGYGLVGAAWATTASYFLYGSLNMILLMRRSGIQPFTLKYIRPALATGIIGLIIYAIAKNLPLYFWMLPFYMMLFIGGYAVSILLTKSIEREDLEILDDIGRRMRMETAGARRFLERFLA